MRLVDKAEGPSHIRINDHKCQFFYQINGFILVTRLSDSPRSRKSSSLLRLEIISQFDFTSH